MLSLIALIHCLQMPLEPDFQYQRRAYSVQGAAAFDSLVLVRPIRRLPPEERTITWSDGSTKVSVVIDEARVLFSVQSLPKTVRIVTPFRGDPKRVFQLKPGRNTLLVSCSANGEALRLPLPHYVAMRGSIIPEDARYATVERSDPAEILGLAAFETKATKLATDKLEPIERLMVNVANCLYDADVETVQRVLGFLVGAQYWPPFRNSAGRLSKVADDAPFVAIMRSAARSHTASNAARIYNLLAWWGVEGAGPELYQALKVAANDPNLGALAGDTFFTGVLFGQGAVLGSARTDEERQVLYDELIDLALGARSQAVQRLLFNNISGTRDIGRQRRILALAASSDEDFARLLLEILARSDDDKENVPKVEKVGRTWIWTNKDALFRYWRERLGV